MTDWKDMTFDEKNKDNNFDFVPKPDNNNNLPYVLVRGNDKYFKSTCILYISEDSNLFEVLQKMFTAFNNIYKDINLTFLIVTKNNNNTGFINHNDLNKPVFALFLWQIFYFFESILTNYLKSNADPSTIEKHIKHRNSYNTDKDNNIDLNPVYYICLGIKLQLYKEKFENVNDPLCIKQLTPADLENLKNFRNRIAHPGNKPKIIRQKSDIRDLFKLLESLGEWVILPEVKAWYPHSSY